MVSGKSEPAVVVAVDLHTAQTDVVAAVFPVAHTKESAPAACQPFTPNDAIELMKPRWNLMKTAPEW